MDGTCCCSLPIVFPLVSVGYDQVRRHDESVHGVSASHRWLNAYIAAGVSKTVPLTTVFGVPYNKNYTPSS
jgi:hypothetical protein